MTRKVFSEVKVLGHEVGGGGGGGQWKDPTMPRAGAIPAPTLASRAPSLLACTQATDTPCTAPQAQFHRPKVSSSHSHSQSMGSCATSTSAKAAASVTWPAQQMLTKSNCTSWAKAPSGRPGPREDQTPAEVGAQVLGSSPYNARLWHKHTTAKRTPCMLTRQDVFLTCLAIGTVAKLASCLIMFLRDA